MMRYPIDQWERASLASLERARQRRAKPSARLMPHGREWLAVVGVALFFAALFGLYIVLWAVL
jgi:hypothetical protein